MQLRLDEVTAGVGEVAKYMSRSAPSSSFLGVRDHEIFVLLWSIPVGFGVRGGLSLIIAGWRVKDEMGRSVSSSSDSVGESGVESEANEVCDMAGCGAGDDCGRLYDFFQDCMAVWLRDLRPVRELDAGCTSRG